MTNSETHQVSQVKSRFPRIWLYGAFFIVLLLLAGVLYDKFDKYVGSQITFAENDSIEELRENLERLNQIEWMAWFSTHYSRFASTKGIEHNSIGDYDEAIKYMSIAFDLAPPENAISYQSRAGAYFATGQYDKAIGDLENALQIQLSVLKRYGADEELRIEVADIHVRIGMCNRELNNDEAALAAFEKAISMYPSVYELHPWLADSVPLGKDL